jgi:hypothetical protein
MRTTLRIACHAPKLCVLSVLCAIGFCGCAIAPRGPIVSHTIDRFSGRLDGLIYHETWQDKTFTRGYYLFADPNLMALKAWHTNQTALGGCSHFQCGSISITVDTNTAAIVSAGGTAVGNVVGAAVKTAVK